MAALRYPFAPERIKSDDDWSRYHRHRPRDQAPDKIDLTIGQGIRDIVA
jgi:hypothetical protein